MTFFNLLRKSKKSQSFIHMIGHPIWGSRNYNNFATNGYSKNVVAYRAINIVATAISSIPISLYQITDIGKHKIYQHPLLKLIMRPNPCMNILELLEYIVYYKMISGNAYLMMVQDCNSIPSELYLLRPDRVQIIPGKGSIPFGYQYNINTNKRVFKVDSVSGKSQILHFKSFNPVDDWYGLSAIEAATYSIEQHNQAGAWNQAMLQNGARPSGALIVTKDKDGSSRNLSDEQYQRLKSQIDDYYSGPDNIGRPILLEGGLDWREMSLSPRDMDFIAGKHSAARDIALAFGVPPQMLGIPGDNTYSNLAEARVGLWEQTIIPQLDNILYHINNWLVPYFGDNLLLSYDKDEIPILHEKREKMWKYVENANFMTINEKRAAFGLKPIDGGNKID